MRVLIVTTVVLAFVAGVVVGAVAASAKADRSMFDGKAPKEAAETLFTVARAQAGKGSWESIAVARGFRLMGDAAAAKEILDRVTSGKMEESDWMRLGRLHEEAGEWTQAKEAFDRALAADPKDAGNHAEIGAWHNLHGDRALAEELFARALRLKSDDVWVTLNIAGSYVGVKPQ